MSSGCDEANPAARLEPEIWAYVALGSNLGDSVGIISAALGRLQTFSDFPLRPSSLWQSEPIDCPSGSPAFVNAVAALRPRKGETPELLLAKLQELEKEFGRRPKRILNEPRPLDLDLIGFGSHTRNSPALVLPHPRAHLRRFVLAPLAEVAPDLVLPGWEGSVAQLLANLGPTQPIQRLVLASAVSHLPSGRS